MLAVISLHKSKLLHSVRMAAHKLWNQHTIKNLIILILGVIQFNLKYDFVSHINSHIIKNIAFKKQKDQC